MRRRESSNKKMEPCWLDGLDWLFVGIRQRNLILTKWLFCVLYKHIHITSKKVYTQKNKYITVLIAVHLFYAFIFYSCNTTRGNKHANISLRDNAIISRRRRGSNISCLWKGEKAKEKCCIRTFAKNTDSFFFNCSFLTFVSYSFFIVDTYILCIYCAQ